MHSWKGKFANFARPYFAPYEITKRTKQADAKVLSEELSLSSCPLGHQYDPDLHDAVSHLRILDGSLPEHPKHGRAVNFFAPEGTAKYWVKSRQCLVISSFTLLTWRSALILPQSLECQYGIPPMRQGWTNF